MGSYLPTWGHVSGHAFARRSLVRAIRAWTIRREPRTSRRNLAKGRGEQRYHVAAMPAKKIPDDSTARADAKHRATQPITTVIDDLDSVRVKPDAATRLMPPWQRAARRKGNAKHSG
jgi:hypothetical protein